MYRILLESPNTTKRLLIRLINLWAKHQAGEQNVMAIENIIFVRKWNFADFFFLFPSHEMRKKKLAECLRHEVFSLQFNFKTV